MPQISAQEYGILQEKLFRFHGFYIRERTIRRYATDHCAHILGDVAEVSQTKWTTTNTTTQAIISANKVWSAVMSQNCVA